MSTYVYLECLNHDPPLSAGDESGQHLTDLPQIRQDIANRELITAAIDAGILDDRDYFRWNTAQFLNCHRKCRIGIRDEYWREHPVTEPATADEGNHP